MVIYGVALLAFCMLVGIILGELLGRLIGIEANIGGIGIAMLLLIFLSNYLKKAFNLGENLGLDLNKLFDVLSTSTGNCWAINTYCPIEGVGPNSPADNNFQPGFSGNLMLKDLTIALKAIEFLFPNSSVPVSFPLMSV